jgi:hypothetical protein
LGRGEIQIDIPPQRVQYQADCHSYSGNTNGDEHKSFLARLHLFLISCITHQANLLQSNFPSMHDHRNLNRKYNQCNSV